MRSVSHASVQSLGRRKKQKFFGKVNDWNGTDDGALSIKSSKTSLRNTFSRHTEQLHHHHHHLMHTKFQYLDVFIVAYYVFVPCVSIEIFKWRKKEFNETIIYYMCVQNTKSKLNKKNIKPVRLLRCCCYCLLYTTRHRTFEDQKLVVYFFLLCCVSIQCISFMNICVNWRKTQRVVLKVLY